MRRLSICGLTALICLAVPLLSRAQGIITTVAGTTWTFRGEGGPATDAPLGKIKGIAVDSVGNVFATDSDNSLVVKISPSGVLTVVAGNRIRGFSGDGGPATNASLNQPSSVAVDTAGNLYIVDKDNQRIRKVTPGGAGVVCGWNRERGEFCSRGSAGAGQHRLGVWAKLGRGAELGDRVAAEQKAGRGDAGGRGDRATAVFLERGTDQRATAV